MEIKVGTACLKYSDKKDAEHLFKILAKHFKPGYPRLVNAEVAKSILNLYHLHIKHPDVEYFHKSEWVVARKCGTKSGTCQYAFTRFLGLIKAHSTERENENKTCGRWKLTIKGKDWVNGLIRVRNKVVASQNVCLEIGGPLISFSECLRDPFKLPVFATTNLGKVPFPTSPRRKEHEKDEH